MANEYWLSDEQWAAIAPFLPKNQPGARRVDDRRILSGIINVLTSGCRWRDCPSVYGPYTTVYNRWNRWSRSSQPSNPANAATTSQTPATLPSKHETL